ncbi:MAG TPA: hypothetical protein VMG11_07615 [Steroidobacteraceae bacterium]|nr:hypothetical protein [Steroidobacteraceae bacterium]
MSSPSNKHATHLETAVALLTRAMRDSHAPVGMLGGALERMALALAFRARAARLPSSDAGSTGSPAPCGFEEVEQLREVLERELTVCIESLQFHDLLMQKLTEVHVNLAALMRDPARQRSAEARDAPRAELASGSIELF